MPLFGAPKSESFPRQWAQMSLDYKLMFVWHGCMMVLFMTGSLLTVRLEFTIAAILLVVLISISMNHRRVRGWHWQGSEPKQLFFTAGGLLLVIVFLYAATPLFPPTNPAALPWYLAGFGIGIMNVLSGLRLVRLSESEFVQDCQQSPSPQPYAPAAPFEPPDPAWQRLLRGAYTLGFLSIWLTFVMFFYFSGKHFRDGTPTPTPTHSEPVTEHGHTVYVTREQKDLDDRLMLISMIGIPAAIIAGPILHFLVGVKLYPNTPTLKEYLQKKSGNPAS